MISYKGRGTRTQFLIINVLVHAVLIIAFLAKSFSADGRMIGQSVSIEDIATGIGMIGVVIYSILALIFETARRFKDINVNGLFSLLLFVPGTSVLFLALLFIPGTEGTNRFGENPRL